MPENEPHAQATLIAGRYLLIRELGRGGMGVVWLAADEFLGRQVAVKELRPPHGLTSEELDIYRRRALQEARSAARIHHPNAVTLYEAIPAGEQDDAMYLIMEFVDGLTLGQLVARHGPLPSARVAALGLQLLDVLEAAHALGIVHRDVKPGNILVTANDQVKLTDFGIAHIIGDDRLTRGGVMGTQAYQAPERFESVPITPAVDLWSLGATLYYAVDGRGPFDRNSTGATLRAIVLDDPPVPRCEAHLADAITRLLLRDPAERATIDQARAELRQVPAQEPAPLADPEQSEPITAEPSGTASRDQGPGWNPDAETRFTPDGTRLLDHATEPERKRVPSWRRVSRRTIVIAMTVVVAVAGTAFGLLATAGRPAAPKSINRLHPTITISPTEVRPTVVSHPAKRRFTPAKAATSSPLSEDADGQVVAFMTSEGRIGEDYYASGWHGSPVLPGTPRAGSPLVISPYGNVFFIEPNGDVVNDYLSRLRWYGPAPIGGTAEAGSALAFFQGSGPQNPPTVVFVNASGKLAYDYYKSSGWHGPTVLPGTPRAGSPLVISPYGNVFFIEPNGDVVNDYLTGSRWNGPDPIGGTAEKGSGLALYTGGATPATRPAAVVFVNASGKLAYDYYEPSGWRGPATLPGAPRAGSPVAWSGDGTSVYFIKANGDVASDYLSGSRWRGAFRTGGIAADGSALVYAPGNGTATGRPNVVFVARDGTLTYDWYANGWHGPYRLPAPAQ
jgi:serine/threonine protein kinase